MVSAKTQLDRPHTSLSYAKGGKGTLVWNAVPQAERYDIYRSCADIIIDASGSIQKVASDITDAFEKRYPEL